jgi:hypothetical protein
VPHVHVKWCKKGQGLERGASTASKWQFQTIYLESPQGLALFVKEMSLEVLEWFSCSHHPYIHLLGPYAKGWSFRPFLVRFHVKPSSVSPTTSISRSVSPKMVITCDFTLSLYYHRSYVHGKPKGGHLLQRTALAASKWDFHIISLESLCV